MHKVCKKQVKMWLNLQKLNLTKLNNLRFLLLYNPLQDQNDALPPPEARGKGAAVIKTTADLPFILGKGHQRKLRVNMTAELVNHFIICCKIRHLLEAEGMRIAPLEVAKYYSHEKMIPDICYLKIWCIKQHFCALTKKIYKQKE